MASHIDSTSSCDTGFPPKLSSPAIPHISIPQYCVVRKPHTNCMIHKFLELHGFRIPPVEFRYSLLRNAPLSAFLTVFERLAANSQACYKLAHKVLFTRPVEV